MEKRRKGYKNLISKMEMKKYGVQPERKNHSRLYFLLFALHLAYTVYIYSMIHSFPYTWPYLAQVFYGIFSPFIAIGSFFLFLIEGI